MLIPSHGIIIRARRGEINLDRLVEILRTTGFITEKDQEAGCSFGSSAMEAVLQDDFEALFSFFFPGEVCDISIDCAATDANGQKGSYAYALFNAKVITRDDVLSILRKQNKAGLL